MKGVSSSQKCKIRVISLDKTSFGKKKGYIRKEIPIVVNIYLTRWSRRAFQNSGMEIIEVN